MLFSYWAFRAADHRAVHLATILVTLLLRYFLVLTRINEMLMPELRVSGRLTHLI
jgi:hypothetical protein